jgi:heme exporter protein C
MLRNNAIFYGYWAFTALLFGVALAMLLGYVPTEQSMGEIQKVFYVHLPSAICTFLAALVACVASVAYIMTSNLKWDDLAASAARTTVLLCSIVLLTGMIWGKSAWGVWWTWSPRLTFSLVLWLLYVVYLILRPSIDSERRRAMVCAVYAIVAFVDVPLVYLSTKLMKDIHPTSISLEAPMRLTLLSWAVAVAFLVVGLIVTDFQVDKRARELGLEREIEAEGATP